jgi:hypothetical protein
MTNSEIAQFLNAMNDFMSHAETEIQSYLEWQEARSYMNDFYEQKAAELEVTVDYYLAEFV